MNKIPQPLFKTSIVYKDAMRFYDDMILRIRGRAACTREVCGIIAEVAAACPGNHVEIGTLFGATAIMAAKFKKSGYVYAIDPLDGYYGTPIDPNSQVRVTPALVMENAEKFGLQKAIHITAKKSSPWPLAEDAFFDTALIDGDHNYGPCMLDWINLRNRVNRYVIFDNYDTDHPGVVAVVHNACSDANWIPVLIRDICIVLERVA